MFILLFYFKIVMRLERHSQVRFYIHLFSSSFLIPLSFIFLFRAGILGVIDLLTSTMVSDEQKKLLQYLRK